MPAPHPPQALAALGRQWVEAWNSRDLERVLTMYSEDTEMTSDRIPALGFDASGTVRGKDSLRAYWSKALSLITNLHFTLIDTYVSPDSVVVSAATGFASICGWMMPGRSSKARRTILVH
jgi:ketosteroid isomerase-like protein